jgi:hypothetical protein
MGDPGLSGTIVTPVGSANPQVVDTPIITPVTAPSSFATSVPVPNPGFTFAPPVTPRTLGVPVLGPIRPLPSTATQQFSSTVPDIVAGPSTTSRPLKRKVLDLDEKKRERYEQQKASLVKARARKKELREADLAVKAKGLIPPSVRMHAVNEFPLIMDKTQNVREFDIKNALWQTTIPIPIPQLLYHSPDLLHMFLSSMGISNPVKKVGAHQV